MGSKTIVTKSATLLVGLTLPIANQLHFFGTHTHPWSITLNSALEFSPLVSVKRFKALWESNSVTDNLSRISPS